MYVCVSNKLFFFNVSEKTDTTTARQSAGASSMPATTSQTRPARLPTTVFYQITVIKSNILFASLCHIISMYVIESQRSDRSLVIGLFANSQSK